MDKLKLFRLEYCESGLWLFKALAQYWLKDCSRTKTWEIVFFSIVIDLSLEREKNYKAGENLIFDTEKGKTNWCKNMRMKLLQKC